MKKTLFTMLLAAIGMVACTSQKKSEETTAPEPVKQKILVLYYSQNGTTKLVAEEIQKQLDADIEEIQLETPYEGDLTETIKRCQEEEQDGVIPVPLPLKSNIGEYDLIFLGYPVWMGTYARPIMGLLYAQNFDDMKIVTFCTFGSGGLKESTENLQKALPNTQVIQGYGVRSARTAAIPEEVNRFLIEGGYKDGEVEALPAFMEHHPVTAEEKAIFNQACSDYMMPLGSPLDVAVRETSTSTDYEFTAISGKKGQESRSTIYVTQSKEEGAKPEFTVVIRN